VFLAVLGHELRNPLAAIQNALVTAQLDASRCDRALGIARRCADRLTRLVDDLLDVARITQGRIELHRQDVPIATIVQRGVESTRAFVDERGHRLSVNLPEGDLLVHADPTRLEQIVANLVTNAAKYTDRGGTIAVCAERDGDDVLLRVRDDGIGIAPEMLGRVFDLFAQGDHDHARAHGGIGIGLTVVRRLVELHGGSVEAHSEGLGKGAEFRVRLPALVAASSPGRVEPVADPAHARSSARVLVVEDNADAAETLAMLLDLLGHRVLTVDTGLRALELARAEPPDVMLVDIGLPGMNGLELARRVREEPSLAHVVLVALTGYGTRDDREAALRAGFDHHVAKPVSAERLRGLLGSLATRN
jgi:two-component system CheB/CheR fusion protein